MNQSYRLVWSVVRSAWTVVSELAKSHAKSGAVMVVVAATAAMPAQGAGAVSAGLGQTVTVVTGPYIVGDGGVGITANNGNIQFVEGGVFTINSTDKAALSAINNGTVAEVGTGGGTYTINTGVGNFYAIEAKSGGKIDLSKAALVDLTTGHLVGVWAEGANSKIDISKLTLNHTPTLGQQLYYIAGSFRASDEGQINIGELHLTANRIPEASLPNGVSVEGLNSTVTIGNATTRSSINVPGLGVMVNNQGSVSLKNIDIISTFMTPIYIYNGSTASLTDVSIAASAGDGSAAGASGIDMSGSTVSLTDVSIAISGENGTVGMSIGSGSTANLTHVSIATSGVAARGIEVDVFYATDESTIINSAGTNISTTGESSGAVRIWDNSLNKKTSVFNGGKLSTTGPRSPGFEISSAHVDIVDADITTTGKGSAGIDVADAASVNLSGNAIIKTLGGYSTGLNLATGATGTLNGASITTSGTDSVGINVTGASTVNFGGTNTITTKGNNSAGLLLANGATAGGTFTGTITTNGANAAGIQSGAANLAVANATVTTGGADSVGIDVTAGKVSLSGTNNVSTTGRSNAVGVKVASGREINFAGTTNISTKGANSTGLLLQYSATGIGMFTGTIGTTGAAAHGIQSSAVNFAMTGATVMTTGAGSMGINVIAGTVSLSGTNNISTTGTDNAVGVNVASGAAIDFAGTTNITTTSDNAVGLKTSKYNKVNFGGVLNILTAGTNSTALLVGAVATVTGTLTGSVLAQNSDAIVLDDTSFATKALALRNAIVSSPSNAVLLKVGDLAVTATDSMMTGDIQAQTGGVLDLTMVGTDKAVSVLTGAIINASNVNIDPSTWNITGKSDAVNLINDASDFRFVNADGSAPTGAYTDFKTVTVNTYTGMNAANIYMNTRLDGDDVTGTYSDKIVVRPGGSMSGDTTFHFANAGGAGAATYDGIKFVDAQSPNGPLDAGKVDKTNFKIAGGYVAAGAYGYVGRQGQYTNLADNQSLFLTNFAPKGATVDSNGFLNGGEGGCSAQTDRSPFWYRDRHRG